MDNFIDIIISLASNYSGWAFAIIFIIAFLESFAIIGVLFPGAAILAAIGLLIGTGALPIYPTLLSAALGAIMGDLVSFLIGRIYKDTIHHKWPFYYFPNALQNGREFFINHGKKSIFTARFVGPVRSIVPLIAGSMNMKLQAFIITDIIAALLWAPFYMLPGAFIAFTGFSFNVSTENIIYYGLTILLLSLLAIWIYKSIIKRIIHKLDRFILRIWSKQKPHNITLMKFNLPIERDSSRTPDLLLLGFIMFGCFFLLSHQVITEGFIIDWNKYILQICQEINFGTWKQYFVMYTLIGEPFVMIGLYISILIYLITSKNITLSILWFINGAIAGGGAFIIKLLFNIQRPLGLETRGTSSFPSAHTTLTIALIGYIYFLTTNKRFSTLYGIFISCLILAMALSRVLLSVHWLTDVLGGLSWGLCCLFINAAFLQGIKISKKDKIFITILSIFTVFILWLVQLIFDIGNNLTSYN